MREVLVGLPRYSRVKNKTIFKGFQTMGLPNNETTHRAAMVLERQMEIIANTVDIDLTARSLLLFATVALHEGRSMGEYAKLLEIPISTASRGLANLSTQSGAAPRNKSPAGLIQSYNNSEDARQVLYRITARGRHLLGLLGASALTADRNLPALD